MFSYVFLQNGHDKRLKYLLMVFVFIQSYVSSPSLGRMRTKVVQLVTFASTINSKILQSQAVND